MAGSSGATDSVATVVLRTDDCAWKQKRSRLIRLSSASERLLARVRGNHQQPLDLGAISPHLRYSSRASQHPLLPQTCSSVAFSTLIASHII
ncbi:hypothetical protein PAMP_016600 [Pampus punctatissimus]